MDSLGLEEDSVVRVSPEVCHGVSAVSTAGQDLQATSFAESVGTLLALLLPACLVTDGRSEVDLSAVGQLAAGRADQHAQAALLENVHIVVVGVSHGPSGGVLLGLLTGRRVDEPTVAVSPVLEVIKLIDVQDPGHDGVVNVPVHGDLALDSVRWSVWPTVEGNGKEWRMRNLIYGQIMQIILMILVLEITECGECWTTANLIRDPRVT